MTTLTTKQIELLHFFDQAYSGYSLNKREKKTLSVLIQELAMNLLDENEDETVKNIYNKYSKSDYDQEAEEEYDLMESLMNEAFGFEGEFDFQSQYEDFMDGMAKSMAGESEKKNTRKKSKKAIEKEEKIAEEEKNLNLSIKEIFRKLVRDLHPDREHDQTQRDRKTTLMKRANVAYEANDLLGLLELQMEIEQIEQKDINALPNEKLKHYNQFLKKQLDELELEEQRLIMSTTLGSYMPSSPEHVKKYLQKQIREVKKIMKKIETDLCSLRGVKNLKSYLEMSYDFMF